MIVHCRMGVGQRTLAILEVDGSSFMFLFLCIVPLSGGITNYSGINNYYTVFLCCLCYYVLVFQVMLKYNSCQPRTRQTFLSQ